MSTYDLTKMADRRRQRADYLSELNALDTGRWPRTLDDVMRWSSSNPDHIRKVLLQGIAYLWDLEIRLTSNHPDLAGWERIDPALAESYRFHSRHGASLVGRHAEGALRAARAELRLRRAIDTGYMRVRWVVDPDPDVSWLDQKVFKKAKRDYEAGRMPFYECIIEIRESWTNDRTGVKHRKWAQVASLWGITLGKDERADKRMFEVQVASDLVADTDWPEVPADAPLSFGDGD